MTGMSLYTVLNSYLDNWRCFMQPTVGRIVHFYGPGGPEAAIITTVHSDECVSLTVFPHGSSPRAETSVTTSGNRRWEWPPRVEEKSDVQKAAERGFSGR